MKWIPPPFRVALPLRNSTGSSDYHDRTFIVVNVRHDPLHAFDWLNEFTSQPLIWSFQPLFCWNLEMNQQELATRPQIPG